MAERLSLGNLAPINQPDTVAGRNLLADRYRNVGAEIRLRHDYSLRDRLEGTLVAGVRAYRGRTTRQQGRGPTGDAADFRFLHPGNLENFNFRFPSTNLAAFAENLLRVGSRLTLTPGIRWEYIRTAAAGTYRPTPAAAPLADARTRARSFPLLGLSTGYQLTARTDLYASIAQNYAAVNFNDLRVANPSFTVDPNLKDSRGYSAEAGYRGVVGAPLHEWLRFDVGAFWLAYQDRIGTLNGNLRTNVADSRSVGAEAYVELHPVRLDQSLQSLEVALRRYLHFEDLSFFASYGFTDARYTRAKPELRLLEGKTVELAPRHVLRTGIGTRWGKGFGLSYQVSYTSAQFADAANTLQPNAAATVGRIPAYTVADLSASYAFARRFTVSAGVNNLTDARYFTRRASGYPGPGILPSDGRAFYGALEVRL